MAMSADGRIVDINSYGALLLGKAKTSLAGAAFFGNVTAPGAVAAEDALRILEMINAAPDPVRVQLDIVVMDGGTATCSWHFCRRHPAGERKAQIRCIGFPTVKNSQAGEWERTGHDLLEGFVGHCSFFIMEIGNNHLTTYVSPGIRRFLGVAPHEVLGKSPLFTIYEEDREAFTAALQTVVKNRRERFDYQYRCIHKDGRVLWFRSESRHFYDDKGLLMGARAAICDIHKETVYREELHQHRHHLEQLVAQRTAELKALQEEVIRKERLAAIGKVAATVSHEIRNPLGTISSTLYVIGEKSRRGEVDFTKPMARANRAIRRCDAIIEELLDFCDTKKATPCRMGIDELAAAGLDAWTPPAGILVERNLSSGCRVTANPTRFRLLMHHLLLNAGEAFAHDTPGRVVVGTHRETDTVHLTVRDTGAGIPEGLCEKVFDPLFSTKTFGVGLGLSICRQIMTEHGGTLFLESEKGKGTQVTAVFPRIPAGG